MKKCRARRSGTKLLYVGLDVARPACECVSGEWVMKAQQRDRMSRSRANYKVFGRRSDTKGRGVGNETGAEESSKERHESAERGDVEGGVWCVSCENGAGKGEDGDIITFRLLGDPGPGLDAWRAPWASVPRLASPPKFLPLRPPAKKHSITLCPSLPLAAALLCLLFSTCPRICSRHDHLQGALFRAPAPLCATTPTCSFGRHHQSSTRADYPHHSHLVLTRPPGPPHR